MVLAAAAILLLTMGARQCLGLFVAPLNGATGFGVVTISLAMAIGQLMWGVAQPVCGAAADRFGPRPVLIAGALLMASGCLLTTVASSPWMLALSIGVLFAFGAGAGSVSTLLAGAAARLPPHRRAWATGVINAGGSMGQFLIAPLAQMIIGAFGWVVALCALAGTALATIPLALRFAKPERGAAPVVEAPGTTPLGLRAQLAQAAGDRSYLCLHAGFFTCGFHIAFLVTHLPGEANLCGLPASVAAGSLALIGLANVAGSLGVGWLGSIVRMKWLLFWTYLARAIAIAVYLALPHTSLVFYAFSIVLGLTWLSTVPPTVGLVGKLFGVRHLATLFGLTLLSHQIGGFLGAWLGGVALVRVGSFAPMWYADMALATLAALANLPVREASVLRTAAAPA
jgi:predicted MFS family arabinose efflux permease